MKKPSAHNGRLLKDPPPGAGGKSHNFGSTAGLFWSHPGIEYDAKKPTFATEGIINALSLIELDFQAIAILSSAADPKKLVIKLLDKFKSIVFAFDNDEAGHKALRKWKECFTAAIEVSELHNEIDAIMLPRGDWNDFLLSGPKKEIKESFFKRQNEFRTYANLALANNAADWAKTHYGHFKDENALFLFEYRSCYYSAILKEIKDPNGSYKVVEGACRISNFVFKPKYRLLSLRGSDEFEYEHRLRVLKPTRYVGG